MGHLGHQHRFAEPGTVAALLPPDDPLVLCRAEAFACGLMSSMMCGIELEQGDSGRAIRLIASK